MKNEVFNTFVHFLGTIGIPGKQYYLFNTFVDKIYKNICESDKLSTLENVDIGNNFVVMFNIYFEYFYLCYYGVNVFN